MANLNKQVFKQFSPGFEHLRLTPDVILKEMGYGAVQPEDAVVVLLNELFDEISCLTHPLAVYRIFGGEVEESSVKLIDSGDFEVGQVIASLLKGSVRFALFVGTAGNEFQAYQNKLKEEGDKPVFAGCIGPFSLAGRLFDLSELMMAIYVEPETITLLLEKCTQFLISYCKAIKETGVNGIIIAEPAAGLISNEDCMHNSTAYIRQIVDAVQDDTFLVVLHNCGNSGHCTEAMIASGAKGLHFGNKIEMTEALAACPPDVLVMGNLDPVGLFKQSTANKVKRATGELLEKTSSWKNFVLSTGCDIPPCIPFENISVFYEALDEYNSNQ